MNHIKTVYFVKIKVNVNERIKLGAKIGHKFKDFEGSFVANVLYFVREMFNKYLY